MRNSALPFMSPFNQIDPTRINQDPNQLSNQSRNASLRSVAEKERKEKEEKERKEREEKERLAKQRARTAEKIKEEGGLKSARTRKLDEIDKDRKDKKDARERLKKERDKKFGKGTELGEKNRESRREKRDNIKQGRKDIQKLNKEIRAKRANERKQAWIDKRVASGKFENAAQAEERFNALKDIRSKQAQSFKDVLGNMASEEQLGLSDDQQTLDVASQNNAADFTVQSENRIQIMD